MQIDFPMTTEDYLAFNVHVTRTSAVLRAQQARQRVAAATAVALILLTLIGVLGDDWVGGAVAAAIGAVGVWFTLPWANRRHAVRTLRRLAAEDGLGVTGDARLTVDDDGLHETLGGMSTSIPWTGVKNVEETDRHVFVFIGPNAALTVPKSANDAAEALDEIRRRFHTLSGR